MTNEIQKIENAGALQLRTIGDAAKAGMSAVLLDDLKKHIARIMVYRGLETTDKNLNAIASFYLADLTNEFPWLDMKEIEQIFALGVRGKLGEYYGINAGTLYDWTVEYTKSSMRMEHLQQSKEQQPLLAQKTERSKEDIDAANRALVNQQYLEYIRGQHEEDAEGSLADIINRNKLVAETRRYPAGHPLFDPGDHLIGWLHEQGFTGSLKDIFEAAKKNRQKIII